MWRAWILSAFAAAVASLAAAGPAEADDRATDPPPTATDSAGREHTWSLLGFNICFGESKSARRCHLELPALPEQQPPPPKRFTLLGKTVCIGGAPQQVGCDWQLPQRQPADAHG